MHCTQEGVHVCSWQSESGTGGDVSAQPNPRDLRPCHPSFVPFGWSHARMRTWMHMSTGSGWLTGHVLCSEPLWFLHDLLLIKDSPCPHVRHPAFPLESVHDGRVRLFPLEAQGHSLPMRKHVLACMWSLGCALGPTHRALTCHADRH